MQLREMNKNHLTILLHRCRKDYVQDIINTKLERINNEVCQIDMYYYYALNLVFFYLHIIYSIKNKCKYN